MVIKTLSVKNFRNHKETKVELSPCINVFIGDNAQGKTNLLEAIFLTCVGRGWRTRKDSDMIAFEEDIARVCTLVSRKYGDITIDIKLARQGKKEIKINDIPIQKMGELMGQINCVFFSPDELRLIKEAPSDRRRFMDIDISQIDKNYFHALLRYNKILAQRNALLKSTTENILAGLKIWNDEFATHAAYIIARRIRFIAQLKSDARRLHLLISQGREVLDVSYETFLGTAPSGLDALKSAIVSALEDSLEKDLRLRTTTLGPHRDDIKIMLNKKDVRLFASQGQQRTAALSIKLAELELFGNETGEKPCLLLDDVFSELDSERQKLLLNVIQGHQTIITTTGQEGLEQLPNIDYFYIKDGSLL